MLVGAIAALWSIFPEKNAREILDAVYQSSDQEYRPDNERGWGLPDMAYAWLQLGRFSEGHSTFAFDRATGELTLLIANNHFKTGDIVEMRNALGQKVPGISVSIFQQDISTVKIRGLANIPAGSYIVRLTNDQYSEVYFVLAWP